MALAPGGLLTFGRASRRRCPRGTPWLVMQYLELFSDADGAALMRGATLGSRTKHHSILKHRTQ